jgi:hypothetical protein
MNERIRELAKQAGASLVYDPDHPDDEPLLRLKHLGIEKFAELIVKECAEIVKDSPWKLGNSYAASDQAWLIKEHFGVE